MVSVVTIIVAIIIITQMSCYQIKLKLRRIICDFQSRSNIDYLRGIAYNIKY